MADTEMVGTVILEVADVPKVAGAVEVAGVVVLNFVEVKVIADVVVDPK